MIYSHGEPITDLYVKNIIGEVFPECCFSSVNNIDIQTSVKYYDSCVCVTLNINGTLLTSSELYENHLNKRLALTTAIGKAVIEYALQNGKKSPPYGVLTGVRPFKIAIDLLSRFEYDLALKRLKETYLVSEDKNELLISSAMYDRKVRENHKKNDCSIYISIPFCPSRCNYCSFISAIAPSKLNMLEEYTDKLLEEISLYSVFLNENNLNLKSVYIGGGTPTVLSPELLDRLLKALCEKIPLSDCCEFTVEAGRPDTISEEKVKILKDYNVDRVCVNCQTTNDEVLKTIGRGHTNKDFLNAFETVKKAGFKTVNTDIIAGLDLESLDSFKNTVNEVIDLQPESITVHTLCLKKSSEKRLLNEIALTHDGIDDFISYAKSECILSGYLPYYLYKQKYTLGNHENEGYCKYGHESFYNIAMMNEIEHIFGLGAGATSRIIGDSYTSKIEHFENYKYPYEYIKDNSKLLKNLEEMTRLLKLTR